MHQSYSSVQHVALNRFNITFIVSDIWEVTVLVSGAPNELNAPYMTKIGSFKEITNWSDVIPRKS
ncbi:hypothetical protein GCM10008018_03700 [Paenibacillus marchantiophytorum]|uniref:Uncharacterized protein n=1 Tax=Paenibacillus marchantiophytorum TaxID=1619310 RepID=A0ABQ2BQI7_9BACL|nr:hypothetical protein GCM10008018_03700 [Paenibacillus marchantiophytorum]